MQDQVLRVGEELVIQGHIRLTILDVEEGKVVLGIADERDGPSVPVCCRGRPALAAVPVPLPSDN
jgi:hypothetical protein